jgi:dihydroorotate dehydrogenase electron transfer subunit
MRITMGSSQLLNFATVEKNSQICADHHLIILQDNGVTSGATKPGQFINLVIPQRPDLFLRRPFSVAKTDPANNLLYIVYRVVGEGTRAMVDLQTGTQVDVMGPLGEGWSVPEKPGNYLLIGGGCGVAPLWGLAEQIAQLGVKVHTVLGFQSEDKVFGEDVFNAVEADITVTTDDGTYGEAGYICEHLGRSLDQHVDFAYICGPMPMVKTVIPPLLEKGIDGEVSYEEIMGCGFGVCLSCVTDIERDGELRKERVCTEGPVFSIKEVRW